MSRWQILSTKQLDTAIINQLKAHEIGIIEQEFIKTETIVDGGLQNTIRGLANADKAVVFTSATAVNAVAQYLDTPVQWKIFCLPGKTGDAVKNSFPGAEIVATAANATELAHRIISNAIKEIVFFCGDHRRDELPHILHDNGIGVQEVVVYRTIETPVKSAEGFHAVLFFSPSAVRSFFSVNKLSSSTICFSIGETTADEIRKNTTNEIIIAGAPLQDALAAKIIEHFKEMV